MTKTTEESREHMNKMMRYNWTEEQILVLCVRAVTWALDDLVDECMDEKGDPKIPSKQALMKARGYLPSQYKHTLQREKK